MSSFGFTAKQIKELALSWNPALLTNEQIKELIELEEQSEDGAKQLQASLNVKQRQRHGGGGQNDVTAEQIEELVLSWNPSILTNKQIKELIS